jgi:antitoxin component of MazEF toxin-antitoxin module
MRLQRQTSRKVGNKEYSKYVIIVPPDRIDKLGWHEGEELTDQVQGKKLVITSKSVKAEAGHH